MIRHLNRLYGLAYLTVIYVICAGLYYFFDVRLDNALITGIGLVGLVVIGAHAAFHIGAFGLSHSVRKLPQVDDKLLAFHALDSIESQPLTTWEWVKAVLAETLGTFKLNTFHQPWAPHIDHLHLARKEWRKTKPLPVLLLHGYMCNAGVWVSTRSRLENLDVSYLTITLEPAIGSIRRYSEQIDQAIDRLMQATGAPAVNVICHSMGGVALRYHVTVAGHDKIHQALTLGSPHFGTALSLLGVGKNVKQMALGSYFLRSLQAHPADQAFQKKITSVWTPQDTIVCPPGSAKLEHAQNLVVRGCGHMHLLDHPATLAIIEEWLSASQAAYSRPTSS